MFATTIIGKSMWIVLEVIQGALGQLLDGSWVLLDGFAWLYATFGRSGAPLGRFWAPGRGRTSKLPPLSPSPGDPRHSFSSFRIALAEGNGGGNRDCSNTCISEHADLVDDTLPRDPEGVGG